MPGRRERLMCTMGIDVTRHRKLSRSRSVFPVLNLSFLLSNLRWKELGQMHTEGLSGIGSSDENSTALVRAGNVVLKGREDGDGDS